MTAHPYRPLTESEIATLTQQGCCADDWRHVTVRDPFLPSRLTQVVFEGTVQLGCLEGMVQCGDGEQRRCELARAVLHDVRLGDGCRVAGVTDGLSRVNVEDRVVIENVGHMGCTGASRFGHETRVAALNEGGGRAMRITARTSAQIAYLTLMYRHDPSLIEALEALAEACAASCAADRTHIGAGSHIANCGELTDVWVGEGATIRGAQLLRDGTVDSSAEAPTCVGEGVIARHFIIQKGARVDSGSIIDTSLVGEATRVGKQCSMENTLLFANSEAFHSELCSVFGGPYTVTHHRATLLIAGYFSFFNAGSGTNQSNHLYKLGPLHQGIVERGSKTGSHSYLLWPARIGAFSVVLGKHFTNFDAAEFPFSYLDQSEGKTVLTPAMNLFGVGTVRDGAKWPSRDRRTGTAPLDQLSCRVFSPYTARKMLAGQRTLRELLESSDKGQQYVLHKGVRIKRLLLKTGARYYALALQAYMGDVLVERIRQLRPTRLRDALAAEPDGAPGEDSWVDLCGLLCPLGRAQRLTCDIVEKRIGSQDELLEALRGIHDAYQSDEWNWFLVQYRHEHGTELAEQDTDTLRAFFDGWAQASRKLREMVLQDAAREFDDKSRLGYGIDGQTEADFEQVRGTFDTNAFVAEMRHRIDEIAHTRQWLQTLLEEHIS